MVYAFDFYIQNCINIHKINIHISYERYGIEKKAHVNLTARCFECKKIQIFMPDTSAISGKKITRRNKGKQKDPEIRTMLKM